MPGTVVISCDSWLLCLLPIFACTILIVYKWNSRQTLAPLWWSGIQAGIGPVFYYLCIQRERYRWVMIIWTEKVVGCHPHKLSRGCSRRPIIVGRMTRPSVSHKSSGSVLAWCLGYHQKEKPKQHGSVLYHAFCGFYVFFLSLPLLLFFCEYCRLSGKTRLWRQVTDSGVSGDVSVLPGAPRSCFPHVGLTQKILRGSLMNIYLFGSIKWMLVQFNSLLMSLLQNLFRACQSLLFRIKFLALNLSVILCMWNISWQLNQ